MSKDKKRHRKLVYQHNDTLLDGYLPRTQPEERSDLLDPSTYDRNQNNQEYDVEYFGTQDIYLDSTTMIDHINPRFASSTQSVDGDHEPQYQTTRSVISDLMDKMGIDKIPDGELPEASESGDSVDNSSTSNSISFDRGVFIKPDTPHFIIGLNIEGQVVKAYDHLEVTGLMDHASGASMDSALFRVKEVKWYMIDGLPGVISADEEAFNTGTTCIAPLQSLGLSLRIDVSYERVIMGKMIEDRHVRGYMHPSILSITTHEVSRKIGPVLIDEPTQDLISKMSLDGEVLRIGHRTLAELLLWRHSLPVEYWTSPIPLWESSVMVFRGTGEPTLPPSLSSLTIESTECDWTLTHCSIDKWKVMIEKDNKERVLNLSYWSFEIPNISAPADRMYIKCLPSNPEDSPVYIHLCGICTISLWMVLITLKNSTDEATEEDRIV
eukprot:GHVH01016269.1.p1 GENE.GHVH01016269.1~~GHVH01016269.1.p1  ORF type:complete len:438 (-),score=55.48 GHVH01016269.1:185-1498(-)